MLTRSWHRSAVPAVMLVAVLASACASGNSANSSQSAPASTSSAPSEAAAPPTSSAPSAAASPATSSAPSAAAGAEDFNGTDISFAAHMLPHHERGVTMAELAVAQASTPEVRALAERISAAQSAEITTLQGFLDTFGAQPASAAPSVMELHQRQRQALAALTGADFDRRFLEMMSVHHAGAVVQSEVELTGGVYAEANSLAEKIKAAQLAEIGEMNGLIAQIG